MTTHILGADFRAFLEGCSEEQAAQITDVLKQVTSRAALSPAPGTTTARSAVVKPDKKSVKKAKQSKLAVATGGPKRPLNSWMAYRNYYTPILAGSTQKSISKCLPVLWNADPFEAKWTILAKSYSIVRGNREKSEAPLDQFFALCAPLIGVIPPEMYLQQMGFQLEYDQEKVPQMVRVFIPDVSLFPDCFKTSNLSTDDLVSYCYSMGYGNTSDYGEPNMSANGALTMVAMPAVADAGVPQMATSAQVGTAAVSKAAVSSSVTADDLYQTPADTITASSTPSADSIDPSQLALAPPMGQAALTEATHAVQDFKGDMLLWFDPKNNNILTDFNPTGLDITVDDRGQWDAYDLTTGEAYVNGFEDTYPQINLEGGA